MVVVVVVVVVVDVDELRASIERHLDDLSDEAERLRAALQALGPGDTSSATSSIGDVATEGLAPAADRPARRDPTHRPRGTVRRAGTHR